MTQTQVLSVSHLKMAKKGIEKHVNDTTVHLSSVSLSIAATRPSQALYVKVETVYFMLKRSCPAAVFTEIMVFIQRLIEYFNCDDHGYCVDIGDKQHAQFEAKRITKIYHKVMNQQIIYIINSQTYNQPIYRLILFAISIDGWSRGIFFFLFFNI